MNQDHRNAYNNIIIIVLFLSAIWLLLLLLLLPSVHTVHVLWALLPSIQQLYANTWSCWSDCVECPCGLRHIYSSLNIWKMQCTYLPGSSSYVFLFKKFLIVMWQYHSILLRLTCLLFHFRIQRWETAGLGKMHTFPSYSCSLFP